MFRINKYQNEDFAYALKSGNTARVQDLLDKGAVDVNHKDSIGRTWLMLSVDDTYTEPNSSRRVEHKRPGKASTTELRRCRSVNITLALLRAGGVRINDQDDYGQSALMIAAMNTRDGVDALELLLSNGACMHLVDRDGWDALNYGVFAVACHGEEVESIAVLRKAMAEERRARAPSTLLDPPASGVGSLHRALKARKAVNVITKWKKEAEQRSKGKALEEAGTTIEPSQAVS